jgi:glycosyltransferase involved in cell wall biosynthesis
VRFLIFHGYLLRGTGSNVYNESLATALVRAGHEVHLLAQERRAEEMPFVDAVGDWDGGRLEVRVLREPVRCTVLRPDIGGLLPVYVADRYEGVEARPFEELSDDELERYIELNVAAVREVVETSAIEAALANHLVMGPVILARALEGTGVPYAAKVHGSALEYTVKPHPRFEPFAHEGLGPARTVIVGSAHTGHSLWAALDDPALPPKTRLGPPGVDIAAFAPRDHEAAREGVAALAARLAEEAAQEGRPSASPAAGPSSPEAAAPPPASPSAFSRDPAEAAAAVGSIASLPQDARLVTFVGKLIVSKGIDLLLAAWPLVRARVPTAHLVVVGFGGWRTQAERLVAALDRRDLDEVRAIAREGRAAEGGPDAPLRYLEAFVDGVDPAALGDVAGSITFTGRLEHSELVDLLPAAEALVMPSTFPEAYGMVAAEAASCGVLPVSAAHSGMAEVSEVLREHLPAEVSPWISFDVGPGAVEAIAANLAAWLEAPAELRSAAREALVATADARFSWDGVARGVIAAAQGRLDAPELRPLG